MDHVAPASGRIERFSAASRLVHWLLATPFLVLLISGLLLFQPEAKAVHVGGHRLVALVHVVAGIAFIGAIALAAVVVIARRAARSDATASMRFGAPDVHWARWAATNLSGGRGVAPPQSKFNLGQKLNSYVSAVLSLGLATTGAVLGVNYFTKEAFDAEFVESVFPWHDAFTFIALPLVVGHLYLAVVHRDSRPSLSGIVRGHVDRDWARRHHALWAEAEEGRREPSHLDAAKRS